MMEKSTVNLSLQNESLTLILVFYILSFRLTNLRQCGTDKMNGQMSTGEMRNAAYWKLPHRLTLNN